MEPQRTNTVIIGAGPAGLACAACLRRQEVEYELLEREDAVASAWRRHYDRLRLHTDKRNSQLPHLGFRRGVPRYPSRLQVIDYLERYTRRLELQPRLGEEVLEVKRAGGRWQTRTNRSVFTSENVIVASGYTGRPVTPEWPGQHTFPGPILHSSAYRNGVRFRGQRVLVVGFGNSGGEIALDLAECGAHPTLSVRGPVNVIPKEILGLPILTMAIPLSRLPARLADLLAAPLLAAALPNLRGLGLSPARGGPFRQIAERRRIPLIDIGTLELLEENGAALRPAVERFEGEHILFSDGRREAFAAVVLATGYRPSFHRFLAEADRVAGEGGVPEASGEPTTVPGLYFCGFYVSPTGMLREIAIEAKRIARHIARKP